MSWDHSDYDNELFEKELASFVPDRVFDAHAHLYDLELLGEMPPASLINGPRAVDFAEYQRRISALLPGRKVSGLFFGFPGPTVNFESTNEFLANEVKHDAFSRGQMLIHPSMDPDYIREVVQRNSFVGLKCYHIYASEQPTFNAEIPSYLPEEQMSIAHEEYLSVTLHMVRSHALADPSNQHYIRQYSEQYPNARLILAHAARGFNPYHTSEGIPSLEGLTNIWFDSSAVTECGALEAIIRSFGVKKLLYGSDFPISHSRGRCVAVGDSFLWLTPENVHFKAMHGEVRPTFVGIESLRVLKQAALNLSLTESQVEALFYGNAASLFGIGSS